VNVDSEVAGVKGAPWLVTLVVAGVLSLLASAASGSAPTVTGPQLMPPHPDLLARIAAEGYDSVTIVDLARLAELKREQGIDQLGPPEAAVTGTRPALVLLVEYSDLAHNPTSTSSFYQNLLFSVGTLVPGSLRDFYQSNSYSQFDISPSAVDSAWRQTTQTHTYYANNDGVAGTTDDYGFGAWPHNAQKLVADAVALADPYVNFASYAVSGQVQGLFVVHAGPGAEVTANPSDIWSHAWALNAYAVTVDGVTVNAYSMEPEYILTAGDSTVGVFCHEYGHVLGLPDLYDTDYSSMGIGAWSVMAGGSWNGTNGNSPAYLDAWSKALLGWVSPTVVTGAVAGASIPAAEGSSTVYRLWTNGAIGTEYFLLENRQRIAGNFDNALPGDGLLLYHMDENASQNTDWHPRVMIEQADGLWDLQYNANLGDAGDPYPGSSNNRTANASTTPNTLSYAAGVTYVAITNVSNSLATMTADLTVSATPSADFTGAPTSGYVPLTVYFTDTSLGLPTSWSWSFGDGGTSTAQHPAHMYTSAGSYTVSLTATNGAGSDTETKPNYITGSVRPPSADFTGTPTSGYVPLDVQFTDTSSYSPTSWSWTFGDGGTSTAQHPLHQYTSAGTYDVSLTATNAGGSDTETKPGYVTASPLPAAPVADFSGTPTSGPAPLPVTFTDQSTGAVDTWAWSFGDGGASSLKNPSHTYVAPGSYDVGLTASNAGGSDTETKTGYITVLLPAPVAAFSGAPTTGVVPLDVSFTDASTGTIDSWLWDFGDGDTDTTQSPGHTYSTVGSFDVSLTVANVSGADTETKTGYIVTLAPAPPVADFSGTPTSGPAPLAVAFTDQSAGVADAWGWEFGDGATSTEQDPAHVYTALGSYDVSLTTSGLGGSDTATKAGYVTVLPDPPSAEFSATPSIGVAPLDVSFSDASAGDPTSWAWGFGDGVTATAQHPAHEYAEVGTYTVSLTASNAGGSDTATKARYILVTFPDVPCEPEEHWALREILACVDAGIVQGYPGGSYGPLDAVTRGQMAVYIARAIATPTGDEGVPEPDAGTQSFTDVDATHWAYRYVEYCYANGLVQGYPGGAYHPDEVVNRGQMAVYMSRAVAGGDEAVPEHIGDATFDDVTEANGWAWCYRHVEYCAAQGIVQGYWDGTYRPANDVTRDQMAVYVARAFELPM
jgi:M6 family metalloprotease-like protein